MTNNVRVFTDEELKVGDVVAQGDWYLVRIAELPKSAKPRASSALGEEADMQSGNRPRFVLQGGLPSSLNVWSMRVTSGIPGLSGRQAEGSEGLSLLRYCVKAHKTVTSCGSSLSGAHASVPSLASIGVSVLFQLFQMHHYFDGEENDFFVSSSSPRPHIVSNGQLYDVKASELSKAIRDCTGVYVPKLFHGPVFQGGTLERTETDPGIKHGTLVFPADAVMAAVRQQEMGRVARD